MTHELPQLLPHCQVPKEQFCETCRDREGGRAFRQGVLERQGIEGVSTDFQCPKKKPWGYRQNNSTREIHINIVKNGVGGETQAKPVGPGTHLHRLISKKYGLAMCQKCAEMVDRMDKLGVEGCQERREEIINDIWTRRHQLKGWKGIAAKMPLASIAGKYEIGKLFDEAVNKAKQDIEDAETATASGDQT